MDRRHKILLNVVLVVLIFAPLFYVLRHQAWLPLYWDALSLFIIIYMCWSFFKIGYKRALAADQPWKKVLVSFGVWRWRCSCPPIICWISSLAGSGSLPSAALLWWRFSLITTHPERRWQA